MKMLVIGLGALILVGIVALFLYQTPTPEAAFGGVSLTLEYATTTAARERGLGLRESLAPDAGMLFAFREPGYYGFWMKDTLIPLDMFWLNDQGQVVTIEKSVATSSYPHVLYPSAPARYVLETNAGFADLHNITLNSILKLKKFPIVSE